MAAFAMPAGLTPPVSLPAKVVMPPAVARKSLAIIFVTTTKWWHPTTVYTITLAVTHITPAAAAALPLLAHRSSAFVALPMATHIINRILAGVHILFVQEVPVPAPHSLPKAALIVGLAQDLVMAVILAPALPIAISIPTIPIPHVLPVIPRLIVLTLPLVIPKPLTILLITLTNLTNVTKPKLVLKLTVLDIPPPNQATLPLPVAMMVTTILVTKPVLTLVSLLALLRL